ncbi:MAG: hypothetical protein J5531_08980 [Lachnospiraceae bacterium]|nr:hypothetical protein [Lachnospiraceae bacterium]
MRRAFRYITEFLRNCFRYPMQDFFLFLSCGIACFLLLDFSYEGERLRAHEKAYHPYYKQCSFYFSGIMVGDGPDKKEWVEVLSELNGGSIFAYLDSTKIGYMEGQTASVLLTQNDMFRYPLAYGMTFESCCKETNAIIVGKSWKKRVQTEDEKEYLVYGGIRFTVAGYFEDFTDSDIDRRAVILWVTLTLDAKDTLVQAVDVSRMAVYSDNEDFSPILNETIHKLENLYRAANRQRYFEQNGRELTPEEEITYKMELIPKFNEGQSQSEVEWYESYMKVVVPFSMVFAFFICWHALSVWLIKRGEEYSVRVAYGYSRDRLALRSVGEIGKMVMLAAGVSLFLQIAVMHRDYFRFGSPMKMIGIMGAGMLLILMVSLVRIYFRPPIDSLRISEERV